MYIFIPSASPDTGWHANDAAEELTQHYAAKLREEAKSAVRFRALIAYQYPRVLAVDLLTC